MKIALSGLVVAAVLAVTPAASASPEALGVSSKGISDWIDACERELQYVHGFVLRRHGQVVAEGSWAPYDTLNKTHMLFSHSKSFTSTAVGFLVDDGKLDLDERVIEILPDKAPANPSENLRQLRVRDLLTMNVGAKRTDAENNDVFGDWEKAFLANTLEARPGTVFRYDSGATYMLAAIVERRSGQRLMDFLKRRLFDPLGITQAWSTTSPSGTPCGGWGMNMTTRELAKFGQLYLQNGVWEGKRLLSSEWIQLATARQTWSGAIAVAGEDGSDWHQGYGFQFWRCKPEGFYRADGANGQLTIVMPQYDAVLSVHAGLGDMQKELSLVWQHLVPAMAEKPLPEDPAASAALAAKLAKLAIRPAEGARDGDAPFVGRTFAVEKNRRGLVSVRLDRAADGWTCELATKAGCQQFPVGFGEWKRGEVVIEPGIIDGLGMIIGRQPIVASAAVGKDGALHLRSLLVGGPHKLNFDFVAKPEGAIVSGWLAGIGGHALKAKPALRGEGVSAPRGEGTAETGKSAAETGKGAAETGKSAAGTGGGLKVELRQTAGGPAVFVNGVRRNPRFYYGSPTCLCNISGQTKTVLRIPFAAEADTAQGAITLDGYYGTDPLWYSDAKLVDLTDGTTNVVLRADEEVRTANYRADGLKFKKGHRYHFVFTHRATRFRTYFHVGVSYGTADGRRVTLPYYYGDTLGDTVRFAAEEAGVDFVTFSTDSSWGCEDWWTPPEAPENYEKLDRECARLIALNPKVLLVPRLMTDAPVWMLKRHPEIRMVYDTGFNLGMSSVSSRLYRQAACAAIERVSRHLKERFPNNYAGLQISGQNSAEWFYMMSQTGHLSGYDVGTRDAFRDWLKAHGDADWATAEVPTSVQRHLREKDARLIEFARFRQREMASFLAELGAAAKRGSRGEALTFFFYGYSWELGGVKAGAGETGHFDFAWLLANAQGKIDGFSSPVSYSCRNLTGSTVMMSAAETVIRQGYLWFNEIDHRTHHEEMWDHMATFKPYSDPQITREIFLRDSAADILRGYGDWWMDLFGRGWFRDREIWRLRKQLDQLEAAVQNRAAPYAPEIASVVHEDSFLHNGWGSGPLLSRRGFARCGADYGQYLLEDFLANPPVSVKLVYFPVIRDLSPALRAKLDAYKAAHPAVMCVEKLTAADLAAGAIAARARQAGVHLWTAADKANVCSAEGLVVVQALEAGPLAIDFGAAGEITDFFTGASVGTGPQLTLPFRLGETRVFRICKP